MLQTLIHPAVNEKLMQIWNIITYEPYKNSHKKKLQELWENSKKIFWNSHMTNTLHISYILMRCSKISYCIPNTSQRCSQLCYLQELPFHNLMTSPPKWKSLNQWIHHHRLSSHFESQKSNRVTRKLHVRPWSFFPQGCGFKSHSVDCFICTGWWTPLVDGKMVLIYWMMVYVYRIIRKNKVLGLWMRFMLK